MDSESIPPAVDWLEQIFRGIEEADAFIFLISPDSALLGILTDGNQVGVYNIENRGLKMLPVGSTIRSIAFSPDGQQFITSDTAGKVQAWDALKAEAIENSENQFTEVSSLASSGNHFAVGARDKITLLGANGDGVAQEIESLGDQDYRTLCENLPAPE